MLCEQGYFQRAKFLGILWGCQGGWERHILKDQFIFSYIRTLTMAHIVISYSYVYGANLFGMLLCVCVGYIPEGSVHRCLK